MTKQMEITTRIYNDMHSVPVGRLVWPTCPPEEPVLGQREVGKGGMSGPSVRSRLDSQAAVEAQRVTKRENLHRLYDVGP